MKYSGLLVLTWAALLSGSCKDGPKAGEFSVDLTTPFSDDGAIQFTATAVTPQTITGVSSACSGCKLFVVKVNDTQYKGVVTGNLVAGPLFRIAVPDTKLPSSYSVQINQVSSRAFTTRSSTSGYSITLR